MPEPADQSAKHGRSLVGFYIAMGAVAALVVLGAVLYRPLHLRFAAYKVRHASWEQISSGKMDAEDYTSWVEECGTGASQGSRLAMEAVFTAVDFGDENTGSAGSHAAWQAATSQPELFFETLGSQSRDRVQQVLLDLLLSIHGDHDNDVLRPGDYRLDPSAAAMLREFRNHASSKDPEESRISRAAFEFVSRHLANELAARKGPAAGTAVHPPIDTEEKAEALIWGLPEIERWRGEIKASGLKKVHLISMVDESPRRVGKRFEGRWVVAVLEDHGERTHRRATFQVEPATGRIMAEDLDGNPVPLDQWRREQPGHPQGGSKGGGRAK